jgi:hypothetical protein
MSQTLSVSLIDDECRSVSPDTIDAASEPANEKEVEVEVYTLEELCKKFVGEVDRPARKYVTTPPVLAVAWVDEHVKAKSLS